MAGSTTGPKHRGVAGQYDEHGHWWVPPTLLPDDRRALPETAPHEAVAGHRSACRCAPCRRYPPAVLARLRGSGRRRG